MGKKKTKPQTITPMFGTPLGFKHLGKPLTVLFGVLDTETVENVWVQNSEEFEFTLLETTPELFTWGETTKTMLQEKAQVGKSLGVFIISHPEFIVETDTGGLVLTGEFLPFKVGESRTWRNPKYGYLLEDSEEQLKVLKEASIFYEETFTHFDAVYRVEQVIDPAGLSDSVSILVDKSINRIVSA